MKGLVCEHRGILEDEEIQLVLCISELHSYGVTFVKTNGEIGTINPSSLKIAKPAKIPKEFEDWRVQMGFESWNQYG